MQIEPLTGARVYDMDDAPDGGLQVGNAVLDLSSLTLPRFTSTAARDTAYSNWLAADTSRALVDDMYCAAGHQLYRYDSSAAGWVWTAGTSPPFVNLTVQGGWSAVSGQRPKASRGADGRISWQGAASAVQSFTPNFDAMVVAVPSASLPLPQVDVPLLVPFATPASGEGVLVCTLLGAGGSNPGNLRTDKVLVGPTPLPKDTTLFLGQISYHPIYTGS